MIEPIIFFSPLDAEKSKKTKSVSRPKMVTTPLGINYIG